MRLCHEENRTGGRPAPSPLARRIVSSPRWNCVDPDAERETLTAGLADRFYEFVEAAAFHLHAQDEAWWQASEDLEDAITPFAVDYILEALHMAGVRDPALMAELCRCVVKGGTAGEAGGFLAAPPEERAELEAA